MTEPDQAGQEILDACLWLSGQGYFGSLRGTGGNVSVRIKSDCMAITPSSVRYSEMSVEDICLIGLDGRPLRVKAGRKPSMESGMHAVIYANRPDVGAIVHTHQTYASVFAVLNLPIPALFDEVSLALGESIDVIPYAFSGSAELAANAGAKLTNGANAYIIQNHGALALGGHLDEAIGHAELLEKVAHIYCLALSTGKPANVLPSSTHDLLAQLRQAHTNASTKKTV